MSKITLKLMQHLQQHPNDPILRDEATQQWYSGGELAADVDQLKDQLKGLHVGHGNVVLVALPNSAVYPVLIQAIWELGAVVMPVADNITPQGLRALMKQEAFTACVVTTELLNAAVTALTTVTRLQLNTTAELTLVRDPTVSGNVAATPTEADPALLVTTPHASNRVSLTYAQLQSDVAATIADYQLTAADRTLLVTALAHREAQVTLLAARLTGGRVVLTPGFTASNFWPQVQTNQITHVAIRPLRLAALLQTVATSQTTAPLWFMAGRSTPVHRPAPHYRIRQPVTADALFIKSPKKAIMKGESRAGQVLPAQLTGTSLRVRGTG